MIRKRKDILELREEFDKSPLNALLNSEVTAAAVGKSIYWLDAKAVKGGGIPFYKIGKCRQYRKKDILEFIESKAGRVLSTSEYKTAS